MKKERIPTAEEMNLVNDLFLCGIDADVQARVINMPADYTPQDLWFAGELKSEYGYEVRYVIMAKPEKKKPVENNAGVNTGGKKRSKRFIHAD